MLPFADVRDAGALLQRAGFALPVTDVETVTVRYATMFDLMADLRAMGATNALSARSRRPATRGFFARAARNLCRALFRSGRTHQGDLLVHLDVGLGAGRLAAEAAEAGLGRGFAGEDTRTKLPGPNYPARRMQADQSVNASCSALSWSANMAWMASAAWPTPPTITSDSTAMMRPYSIAVAPLCVGKESPDQLHDISTPLFAIDPSAHLLRKVNGVALRKVNATALRKTERLRARTADLASAIAAAPARRLG